MSGVQGSESEVCVLSAYVPPGQVQHGDWPLDEYVPGRQAVAATWVGNSASRSPAKAATERRVVRTILGRELPVLEGEEEGEEERATRGNAIVGVPLCILNAPPKFAD